MQPCNLDPEFLQYRIEEDGITTRFDLGMEPLKLYLPFEDFFHVPQEWLRSFVSNGMTFIQMFQNPLVY